MTTTITTATPRCPHFGQCGGCQLQNIAYEEQLSHKRNKLAHILQTASIDAPTITTHASEPYEYRNRIRLRLERIDGTFRLGYNRADSNDFLPITTCSIAAPILWQSAEALLSIATINRETEAWLNATAQVELFTNDTTDRVQLTLLCNGPRKTPQPATFLRFAEALQQAAPYITSIAAVTYDPRTALTGRTLASHGPAGLTYMVN
ncbi:MAG: 23S rRNA (uracil(1939)-C(5))-methyltransferase RlmD, partial [Acidobacteriota bacterium]